MAVIQTPDKEEWEGQTATQVRHGVFWFFFAGKDERKVEQRTGRFRWSVYLV